MAGGHLSCSRQVPQLLRLYRGYLRGFSETPSRFRTGIRRQNSAAEIAAISWSSPNLRVTYTEQNGNPAWIKIKNRNYSQIIGRDEPGLLRSTHYSCPISPFASL